jgi:hypothetical protein
MSDVLARELAPKRVHFVHQRPSIARGKVFGLVVFDGVLLLLGMPGVPERRYADCESGNCYYEKAFAHERSVRRTVLRGSLDFGVPRFFNELEDLRGRLLAYRESWYANCRRDGDSRHSRCDRP